MQMQLNMVGIVTNKFAEMRKFYEEVLELEVTFANENYVEFKTAMGRLAITTNAIMLQATGSSHYQEPKQGAAMELAFIVDQPTDVDTTYQDIIQKGATPIKEPADQPWGQRTAFFADPDGNIHEVFANLQ